MGRLLRLIYPAAAFAFLIALCLPCRAAAIDDVVLDANAITQLEQRAISAKPREQCFLYTELVHAMTEMAGREMLAGNVDNAAAALKKVQHYAGLIHTDLSDDAKRLMNAQMLMHHTTRRLGEYVRKASYEDRETMQATLKQLTAVEDELLTRVFAH